MQRRIHKRPEVQNLQLRQTMLEEKATEVKDLHEYRSVDEAFQALAGGLIFGIGYDAMEPDEIIDGSHDKQVDILRIEEDPDSGGAHIHVVQVKNTTRGFASNTLVKMRNGLAYIFDRPSADYRRLRNENFVNKIVEVRDLRSKTGNSNITVTVYLITRGDAQNLSEEFTHERDITIQQYSSVGFHAFNFRTLGALELVELLNEIDRADRKIDADLPMNYDVNKASVIEYTADSTKAVICTVSGRELATLAASQPRDAIFDFNVRPYYGARGSVNADIAATSCGDESGLFWFLNNGITMVCDSFDLIKDPDNTLVKLVNVQIVNGCQTAVTLREALEAGTLKDDVRVLVRIYATANPNLTDRITLTTNNQNRITDRDLRANDSLQKDIQHVMRENYSYYYERKNREFTSLRGSERRRILPNYKAAQAYLAIAKKRPSHARGYRNLIWSDHYEEIFSSASVEDLLVCYLLHSYCNVQARRQPSQMQRSLEKGIAVYGSFHLARIMGHILLQDKWGSDHRESVRHLLAELDTSVSMPPDPTLVSAYDKALSTLTGIYKSQKRSDIALYFKATEAQKDIESALAKLDS